MTVAHMPLTKLSPSEHTAFLKLLIDSTMEGFFSIDTDGRITLCNAGFLRMLGYDGAEDIVGGDVRERMQVDDSWPVLVCAQTGVGQSIARADFRRKDGTPLAVEYRARPIVQDGAVTGAICTFVDISERIATTEALARSNEQLRLAQKAGGIGIFILTAANSRMTISGEFCRVFGLDDTDSVQTGDISAQILAEDRTAASTVADRADGSTPAEAEYRIRRKNDGEIRWILRRAEFVNEGNTGLTMLGTVQDITDRKMAALAAEAANLAKSEFLANMSHEIRTPMNAIIGLSTILANSRPLTMRQSEFIRTLSTSADSLLGLINDLLDIAKIEARSVELEHIPFSLNRPMIDIAAMMAVQAHEKGLKFVVDTLTDADRIHVGDPTRLRQIIVNLCGNAIKFTEHGQVTVTIACQPNGRGDIVTVSVRDTGAGIASDKIEGIFHKFVQADSSINRRYGGSGLGLTITRTLVEIMGGTISVRSREGKGSVFEAVLPLERAAGDASNGLSQPAEADDAAAIEPSRPQVLLVEDYEPNILVAGAFLDDFGYGWDVARNGLEAFEKVKQKQYSATLMDVQMPGVDGLEATRMIRDWEDETGCDPNRIIGMTAHALSGDRERCLKAGMDDYISKPFHPDVLRRKIQGA